MLERHLKKLRIRDDISAEEERVVESLVSQVVEVPADRTIVRNGTELHESILLLDGWLGRVKDLHSGQRQMAELHVPGDFADLHGFTLKRLDHDVITISPCRLALVPHERLTELTEKHAHLARLYWLMTNVDAAIHREWTLSLGRRSAQSAMSHLFCELLVRLKIVGLTEQNSFYFPLTQAELGECLGLTAVHVNRTLQQLRRLDVVDLQSRRVTIHDLERLKEIAEFDDDYLYLTKRPR